MPHLVINFCGIVFFELISFVIVSVLVCIYTISCEFCFLSVCNIGFLRLFLIVFLKYNISKDASMDLPQIINRLDEHVYDFFTKQNVNSARKAGEAIARIILRNANPSSNIDVKYEQLITSLTTQSTQLTKFFLGRVQSELRVLQTYGNADSHDSDESLNTNDLTRIQRALTSLLGYLFDSKDEYNLDYKIPNYIYGLLNESNISDDNWRCQSIISSIYPNRRMTKNIKDKDFDFYVVEDADGRYLAFLGLNRNISFTDAFSRALTDENLKDIQSLTFLFPLEISKTTQTPVKMRKEYIKRISASFLQNRKITCLYYFYDDYIWDKCLPSHIKSNNDIVLRDDFIDQNLFDASQSHMSLDFVDSLISNIRLDRKPLNLIFGEGGVGKTTFCEQAVQKINRKMTDGLKKKAIFISSIDIPDESFSTITEIASIEDLYFLVFDGDEETKIDKNSLALNISCGNLIIIIDGLDELLSKLKDKFNASAFFESIKKLNDTYRNCTVIITSRDIELSNLDTDNTNILHLKGFDDELISKYLSKRFRRDSSLIGIAYKGIKDISSTREITPLIIRLVSDLASEDIIGQTKLIDCSYLDNSQPLDKVILQLIAREIQKQFLDMSGNQYFMLLQSIVFEHNGRVKESEFCEQIQYILQSGESSKLYNFTQDFFNSYLVSSLLERKEGFVLMKYDSIEFVIKARYLTHIINSESENDITINTSLMQDCFKGGALVHEISKNKKSDSTFEKDRIGSIISEGFSDLSKRKLISALLYIFFSKKKNDRSVNSEHLKYLFGSDKLKGFSIFGDFYPIDFTAISVDDGYFDNYNNLSKSLMPKNKTVFNNCRFVNFSEKGFKKGVIYPENFNSDCELSEGLKKVMDVTLASDTKRQELIEDDLIKIFKVGYKNGAFIWKSLEVYKQQCASLKTRFNLLQLLNIIEEFGFLIKEEAKASSSFGYKANAVHGHIIKDFITQRIIGDKINKLIDKIDNY